MPIQITNRTEMGRPLTQQEMDNDILERMVDFMNALEMLMSISLNFDGTLKNPGFFSGASTNGTDSYTATVVGIAAQVDLLGKLLILKVDVANTGPSTLNVNGYGAFPIMRFQDQAIESDYIKANNYIFLTWQGSHYQMQSFPGVVPPVNYGVDTGAVNAYVVAKSGYIAIPATLYPGYSIYVKTLNANTGASTLALGGLPATTITRRDGSSLLPGDIPVGIFQVIYDGANFFLPTAGGARVMTPWLDPFALDVQENTVVSHQHNLGAVPEIVRVVLRCNTAENGYVPGAELNIENVQQQDGDSAVAVLADATSVYVILRPEGNYVLTKGDASGGSQPMSSKANWNIKIYAAKV